MRPGRRLRSWQAPVNNETTMKRRLPPIWAVIVLPALAWQTHRVGTKGPEMPPLQGAGRRHYPAPLPHARSEIAVAEANGKIYVLGGYADGFVDQSLNEEYDPVSNTWRVRAPMLRGLNHVGAIGLAG